MNCFKKLKSRKSESVEDSQELASLNSQPVASSVIVINDDSTTVNISDGEEWRAEMFEAIKRKNASRKDLIDAFDTLDINITNLNDLFDPDNEKPHHNILQYACNLGDEVLATEYAKRIFEIASSYEYGKKDIHEFVNHPGEDGWTALLIAISKDYKDIVLLLLKNGADVNVRQPTDSHDAIYYIYTELPQVMLKLFDNGIQIKEGFNDTTITCDFSTITGIKMAKEQKTKYNEHRETSLLVTVIGSSKVQRSAILLHPLVQTFLHKKGTIWIHIFILVSVFYQIFWSILSVIYLGQKFELIDNIAENVSESHINRSTNNTLFSGHGNLSITGNRSEPDSTTSAETSQIQPQWMVFVSIFWVCYAISLAIELTEIFSSPTSFIYWGQWINRFQIALLIIHPVTTILSCFMFSFYLDLFGIFAALLLVQGQITKFSWVGIYNQMLFRIFRSFFKFFVAFSPMLVTFMLIFHYLLKSRPQFALKWGMSLSKIFAMLTGELEHNEIFFPEEESQNPVHPILTTLVFIIFVIAVVILLQNLLIGLSVQDVEILKGKCMTDHLTTRLEAICMIEHLLTGSYVLRVLNDTIKNCLLRRILVGPALNNVTPPNLKCGHPYVTKLSKLPEPVRNAIKEKYMPETDPNILNIISLALAQFQLRTQSK